MPRELRESAGRARDRGLGVQGRGNFPCARRPGPPWRPGRAPPAPEVALSAPQLAPPAPKLAYPALRPLPRTGEILRGPARARRAPGKFRTGCTVGDLGVGCASLRPAAREGHLRRRPRPRLPALGRSLARSARLGGRQRYPVLLDYPCRLLKRLVHAGRPRRGPGPGLGPAGPARPQPEGRVPRSGPGGGLRNKGVPLGGRARETGPTCRGLGRRPGSEGTGDPARASGPEPRDGPIGGGGRSVGPRARHPQRRARPPRSGPQPSPDSERPSRSRKPRRPPRGVQKGE